MTVSTLTKVLIGSFLITIFTGCQAPYLLSGAIEQTRILRSRRSITKVLQNVAVSQKTKEKLLYSQEALQFAINSGLKCKNNFKTFVQLDRPYVSYLITASKKHEIKPKKWWFPIIGSFPYKGFFSEKKALKEQKQLKLKNYDTYMRGVTAYSSLGWFSEPILSSMLRYSKHSLAETIFHECFHRTVFIKNDTETNERLAVFFAHKILLEFLKEKKLDEDIKRELLSWRDQLKFSTFLKNSLLNSEKMYQKNIDRLQVFREIQDSYTKNLKPLIKVNNYDSVFLEDLNNAKLAAYKTYFHDFTKLEKILNINFKGEPLKFLYKLQENPSYLLNLKKSN